MEACNLGDTITVLEYDCRKYDLNKPGEIRKAITDHAHTLLGKANTFSRGNTQVAHELYDTMFDAIVENRTMYDPEAIHFAGRSIALMRRELIKMITTVK